jgi:hypothetical protein
MNIAIRPAILTEDYDVIAAVLAAESPGWAKTAEELGLALCLSARIYAL